MSSVYVCLIMPGADFTTRLAGEREAVRSKVAGAGGQPSSVNTGTARDACRAAADVRQV